MPKLTRNAVTCKGCGRTIEIRRRGETKEHHCDKNRRIVFTIGGGLDKVTRTVKFGTNADNFTDLAS